MKRKIRDLEGRPKKMKHVTKNNFRRKKKHREEVFKQTGSIPDLNEESDLTDSVLSDINTNI